MATIIFLKENSKINEAVSNYGAIIKIGRKTYAISFQSSKYYEGDEVSFSPENMRFLEANVRPTPNMIFEARMAIIKYRIDYRTL